MKRYVFNPTGITEHPLGSLMMVSELRELLEKKCAEDYGGNMSTTKFIHREQLYEELLAELDKKCD